MIRLFALFVAVKGIFSAFLKVVDVSSDDGFCHLVHILDGELLFAPALEKTERLFVGIHRLFSELTASTVDHELVNLPIEGCVHHKKTLPVHQDFAPNKLRVFIGLKKKVYRFFKPSTNL